MLRFSRYIPAFTGLVFLLASCGWVEVPPEGSKPTYGKRPLSSASTPYSQKYIQGTVIVQKGDTVYAISRRNNVSVRSIIDINNLKAPFHLQAGQRIRLPQARVHIVKQGETLYSVSRAYRTDVYTLAKINSLKSPFTLSPGQRLSLPGSTNLTTASKNLSVPDTPRVKAEPLTKPAPHAKPAPRINKQNIPKPPPRASSRFSWPVQGRVISRFGAKKDGLRNDGINISAKRGSAVKAAENGVVAYSGNELRGFGNMILVKHSGGWITAYAHAEKLLVKRGQKVKKGQTIASVGSSGGVTSPQLHFEIRRGMNPVNPKKYLGG